MEELRAARGLEKQYRKSRAISFVHGSEPQGAPKSGPVRRYLEVGRPLGRWSLELGRPVGSADWHRKGSWSYILRIWKPLGHPKKTRRAHGATDEPQSASHEAPWRCIGSSSGSKKHWNISRATILDAFIVFRACKNAAGGTQATIFRFCWRVGASEGRVRVQQNPLKIY